MLILPIYAQQVFTDIPLESPYYWTSKRMKDVGITLGCGNGTTFCPNDVIPRWQMAVFVIRGIYGGPGVQFNYPSSPFFDDVPSTHDQFPYIQKMAEMGITQGCAYRTFCPDNPTIGIQAAIFTNRAAQRKPSHPLYISDSAQVALDNTFLPRTTHPWFSDVPGSDPYFRWIQTARDLGVIKAGCSGTSFCGWDPITRGTMSFYVVRGILDEFPPYNGYTQVTKFPGQVKVEGNSAFIPLDLYENINSIPGISPFPVYPCSSTLTVRQCFQRYIANLVKQGVTDLRFFFGLRGGAASTAIDSNGNIQQTWVNKLALFFHDVRNTCVNGACITKVSLHPAMAFLYDDFNQFGGYGPITEAVQDCNENWVTRRFWATSPLGYLTDTGFPDNTYPNNGSLDCSPPNPYFVGWHKIYALMDRVVKEAVAKGLEVSEIEYYAEMKLTDFVIDARWIYDNKHGSDMGSTCEVDGVWVNNSRVHTCMGRVMEINGFSKNKVTPSVAENRSTGAPDIGCNSVYGYPARVIYLSELDAALTSGKIGRAARVPNDFVNGLECNGQQGSQDQLQLAFPTQTSNLPSIVHLHSYACVGTPPLDTATCQQSQTGLPIQNEAKYLMNAIKTFRDARWPGAQIVIGETHAVDFLNQAGSQGTIQCAGSTPVPASGDMVEGFKQSGLAAESVVFRPFNEFQGDAERKCTPWPPNWNKGEGPYAK